MNYFLSFAFNFNLHLYIKVNAATAKVFLAAGVYVISVYAAYDETGSDGAAAGTTFRDSLTFIQEDVCDVHSWRVLDPDALKSCGGNEVRPEDQPGGAGWGGALVKRTPVEEEDEGAGAGYEEDESAFDASKIDGESLKKGAANKEGGGDAELTGLNVADSFEGAFISLKMSLDPSMLKSKAAANTTAPSTSASPLSPMPPPPEGTPPEPLGPPPSLKDANKKDMAKSLAKNLLKGDNYLVVNARIILLQFMVEIDVRVVSGPAEKGGGMHAKFVFEWTSGVQQLAFLNATMDMTPFDFSKDGAKKLLQNVKGPMDVVNKIFFYIGIEIKPRIINVVLEFMEPALRILFMIMMTPLVLAITVAQTVLNLAIKAVEAARKAIKDAEKFLSKLERAMMSKLSGVKRRFYYYESIEKTSKLASQLTTASCTATMTRTSSQGCIQVNGVAHVDSTCN